MRTEQLMIGGLTDSGVDKQRDGRSGEQKQRRRVRIVGRKQRLQQQQTSQSDQDQKDAAGDHQGKIPLGKALIFILKIAQHLAIQMQLAVFFFRALRVAQGSVNHNQNAHAYRNDHQRCAQIIAPQ